RRCSHDVCTKTPCFNVEGRTAAKYCKQHAVDGMVDIKSKRCTHNSCLKFPGWGLLTETAPTACLLHKCDISGSPVINFWARCKVTSCKKVTRWGLDGTQPTHCRDH
ncbi:unnamed protein product, partial [Scytosiphon promiscuus]